MKKTWHIFSVDEVAKEFRVNPYFGLSEEEVKKQRQKFGFNKLPEEKPLSKLRIFLEQFKSPLIYILVIAGIVTLFLKEYADVVIIFGAVFLNTLFGFIQENKASKILFELKKIGRVEAYVMREGNEKEVEQSELVPGDIFLLQPGSKIPADGRLIEVHNLKINEALLTGEWFPSEKTTEVLPERTHLADRDNMVYMGCVIEDGRGKAVATETGAQTELGKIAQSLKETKEEKTPYQKKLINFSKIVGLIIVLISIGIFIEGILTGGKFGEISVTAIAIAVAAIPEGLPIAMTVILALGMQRILKKRGLVRKMVAAETLGGTSIICTDKTGTLTEAKMQVAGIFTDNKELLNDGKKFSETIDKNGSESHILALKIGMLCTEAFIENSEDEFHKWIIRGRPMEKALLLASIQAGFSKKELEEEQPKIDELFFDPVYKYSATLRRFSDEENILYILGAPEIILKMSGLSSESFNQLNKKLDNLASRGSRVLGCAYKRISNLKSRISNLADLCDEMTFVAFITFHDPLRQEAKEAINICQKAGMRPIIVTGDHKLTTKAIAEELGLPAKEENIIEGSELEKLSEEEFKKRLKDIEIYARVEPKQKLKIVQAWQEQGETVAMTGDGVNDAPALKQADIGVALGSGTEVAKEASDLVLLNDGFSVIVAAVEEGRAILDNIRKVITYLLSDSFTETILIGVSIFSGFPLPLTAAQILWVNVIEDSLPNIALAFEPKEKDLMKQKPQNHKIPLLTKEMKALIFVIGFLTDLLLLGLFFWLIKYSGYEISHIRSIIFAGLAIDSLFYVFSCKSLRKNLWQMDLFSNKFLVISWLFGIAMLLAGLYFLPFQALLKTVPLSSFDWLLLLGLGVINLGLIEITKWYFITKSKTPCLPGGRENLLPRDISRKDKK